jgi:hypothetical protein
MCTYLVALATMLGGLQAPLAPKDQVARVLDDWHDAAAKADEKRYFDHLATDSIFMGTDATERWTKEEFRRYAKPHFDKGKAWSFKASKRFITLARDERLAWFDEELDTPNLGPARGSGVLVLDGGKWKIVHYNLSVPIPNDVFKDVRKVIDSARKPKE